jgi:hypothetical protein
MFGGQNRFSGMSGSTWTCDGGENWFAAEESDAGPVARRYAAMAYCELTDTYVLFGGVERSGHPLGDTWVYSTPNIRWH